MGVFAFLNWIRILYALCANYIEVILARWWNEVKLHVAQWCGVVWLNSTPTPELSFLDSGCESTKVKVSLLICKNGLTVIRRV